MAAAITFAVAVLIAIAVFLYVRHQGQDGDPVERKRKSEDGNNTTLKRPSSVLPLEKLLPVARRSSTGLFALHKEVASPTTPTVTLINSTDTWYNKRQAELSTTSLTSKTHNAHNPIPKSPSITEFSDAASIYSATTSIASMDGERPSAARTSATPASSQQPPPPLHRSIVVGSQYIFNPSPTSFSQPRPPTSHSEKSRPTTAIAAADRAQASWATFGERPGNMLPH
ncbi:hypothetical protein DV735_g4735, partial [Chaetothyriales sp. CBS 134920]